MAQLMNFEQTGPILEDYVDYKLIGPLRALRHGQSLHLGGPKQRAVLAVLLLSHGRVVEFEKLIDAVWNGTPPVKAISSLRAYVANLRRILGDDAGSLLTTSYGYRLDLRGSELDVERFEALVAQGRAEAAAGAHASASAILGDALGYWTGTPLEDLRDLTFSVHETHRLQELRADAVETYFECRLAVGHHAEIIGQLDAELLESPLRERLWGQLMVALHRSDRRADALRTFERAARILDEELGIEPGAALVELDREIRCKSDTMVWQSPSKPLHGLVGRGADVVQIEEAVSAVVGGTGSIVMLAGEPGIGKSTLAAVVVARADAAGISTAWASPPAGVNSTPLWSWIHVLRTLGDSVDRERLARAAAVIAPELLDSLPGWPTGLGSVPAGRIADRHTEFRLIDSVALALRRLVEGTPTMIVIDDLDRCDRATRDVLYVLAGNLHRLPLVVIAAFHDDGMAPRSRRTSFDRLIGRSDTTLIRLRGLDLEATAAIIAAAGAVTVSTEFAAEVHRRTAGNPFCIKEIARIVDGVDLLEIVPDGVAAMVRRRTAALPVKTRKALRIRAAQSQDASFFAEPILDSAVGEGLLVREPGSDEVHFASPLIRDAVAAQCTRAEIAIARRSDATRLVRVASHGADNLWQQVTRA